MKELIYYNQMRTADKAEVLHSGTFMGYKFAILNRGTHPVAYVENKNGFAECENADEAASVHGGVTYLGGAYWDKYDSSTYIGWDYAHLGDWFGMYDTDFNTDLGNHKWATEEIFEEVKGVIRQLSKCKQFDDNTLVSGILTDVILQAEAYVNYYGDFSLDALADLLVEIAHSYGERIPYIENSGKGGGK